MNSAEGMRYQIHADLSIHRRRGDDLLTFLVGRVSIGSKQSKKSAITLIKRKNLSPDVEKKKRRASSKLSLRCIGGKL